jgi:hypothetical protein
LDKTNGNREQSPRYRDVSGRKLKAFSAKLQLNSALQVKTMEAATLSHDTISFMNDTAFSHARGRSAK